MGCLKFNKEHHSCLHLGMDDLWIAGKQSLWWFGICLLQIVHPLQAKKNELSLNIYRHSSKKVISKQMFFLPLSMVNSPKKRRSLLLFVTRTPMISGGLFWFATNSYQQQKWSNEIKWKQTKLKPQKVRICNPQTYGAKFIIIHLEHMKSI